MVDGGIILTIIGIVVTAIGGKEAWSYYKERLAIKAKIAMSGNNGETELRNEIKDMLEGQILELKEQVRLLTGRIKFMEEEREGDKKRIAKQEIQITLLSERLITRSRGRK